MSDITTMSETEAQALCHEWQRRLRVQDWDVRVLVVSAATLDGDRAAVHRITPKKRLAVIRLAKVEELSEQADDPDLEVSIVHELLHLHLWEMTDALHALADELGALAAPLVAIAHRQHEEAEERAVYALAQVLVALKRAAQHESQPCD